MSSIEITNRKQIQISLRAINDHLQTSTVTRTDSSRNNSQATDDLLHLRRGI